MAECAHPFSLVTKSSGIERDLDLVAPMAARGLVAVYVSVTSLDPQLARILEPRAAAPHRRLSTVETLARAGVPVGVSVSPIIPVHQRAGDRAHPRGRGGGRRELGVRHRPAPAVGGEPDLPALARPALSRPRRARHGARARDARRQGLRRELRLAHEGRGRLGAAARSSGSPRPRRASASTAIASCSTSPSSGSRCRHGTTARPTCSPEGRRRRLPSRPAEAAGCIRSRLSRLRRFKP